MAVTSPTLTMRFILLTVVLAAPIVNAEYSNASECCQATIGSLYCESTPEVPEVLPESRIACEQYSANIGTSAGNGDYAIYELLYPTSGETFAPKLCHALYNSGDWEWMDCNFFDVNYPDPQGYTFQNVLINYFDGSLNNITSRVFSQATAFESERSFTPGNDLSAVTATEVISNGQLSSRTYENLAASYVLISLNYVFARAKIQYSAAQEDQPSQITSIVYSNAISPSSGSDTFTVNGKNTTITASTSDTITQQWGKIDPAVQPPVQELTDIFLKDSSGATKVWYWWNAAANPNGNPPGAWEFYLPNGQGQANRATLLVPPNSNTGSAIVRTPVSPRNPAGPFTAVIIPGPFDSGRNVGQILRGR